MSEFHFHFPVNVNLTDWDEVDKVFEIYPDCLLMESKGQAYCTITLESETQEEAEQVIKGIRTALDESFKDRKVEEPNGNQRIRSETV